MPDLLADRSFRLDGDVVADVADAERAITAAADVSGLSCYPVDAGGRTTLGDQLPQPRDCGVGTGKPVPERFDALPDGPAACGYGRARFVGSPEGGGH